MIHDNDFIWTFLAIPVYWGDTYTVSTASSMYTLYSWLSLEDELLWSAHPIFTAISLPVLISFPK
jgi:hypothetical protein